MPQACPAPRRCGRVNIDIFRLTPVGSEFANTIVNTGATGQFCWLSDVDGSGLIFQILQEGDQALLNRSLL